MNSRFPAPELTRPSSPSPDGDLIDLRRLFAIARRQFATFAACTLVGSGLGFAWLAAATPLYTATATLFVNPLAGAPLTGALAPVVAVGLIESETGILLSEKIASDAFTAIDPASLAAPPSPLARLKRLLRPALASPEARRQAALDDMRARFEVAHPDTAFLLQLSFTSPSPEHAAAILDAFVAAYLADRAERRRATAEAQVAAIKAQIAELEAELAAAARTADAPYSADPRRLGEQADARRRAAAYSAAIGELLARGQQARALPASGDDQVRVVSPPRVPVFDSSPNAARTLLLSTLAGALAGIALGLLREGAERGFRSAGQVRRELGVPCLALLPRGEDPGGGEALCAVKLAIDQATGTSRPRLVGFAPAAAGDGATTVAHAFAGLLAAGGASALLLDADLRTAGLTRALGLDDTPGFADMLDGRSIAPLQTSAGLPLLSAGSDRSAAAAIALGAAEAGEALARAAAPFDLVVVDLPPLADFVDARAMARHLDAIVIVARWRRTERRRLRTLLAADRDLRRRLVGVILTCAVPTSVDRFDDDVPLYALA
ncbi:MAG TPA: Wzz/FepE/Etk N-terminal domain-containing protein [Amaricoccus sp.]|uniref:Wzz/FepE/Etk N-terminal domain-containing protein n=1 Tax=Amaricoccus sp. TaxID=1872485 RepID=UPI002CE36C38|nr:Wzz/FepE/Etk N-terminal domain-containing protein [Amaricoccus sp.]HRO10072.1 Wzz/FepE/Etk N-terminal domain-containing protein [Amaricoccus sp.]